jgi:lysophospholipase L1-like esterase
MSRMLGRRMRRTRLAGMLVAAALVVSACSSSGDAAPPGDSRTTASPSPSTAPSGAADPPAYARYVALGDSYSAGPLIPTTDLAGGCVRSDHNYPSLVARRLGVRAFTDATCSGATTRDLTQPQHPFEGSTIPPQLSSLSKATDLVTIGIGGNNLNLFATLIRTCTGLRAQDPQGSPCTKQLATLGPDLGAATATIAGDVTGALRAIRQRAPRAEILLVGYLRLVPDRGSCPALPLATGDYAEGRRISLALNRALKRAARRTHTRFVDAYALSRGHDICSAEPWVNGQVTDRQRALAYHPFAAGMRAVADGVLASLRHR